MEITNIKLARTTESGTYLNPKFNNLYNSTGNGTIVYAEPWVQKANKQLWVDGVCINPDLNIETITYTASGREINFDFALINRTVSHGKCAQTIEFDFAALKDYFSNTGYFNNFNLSYCTRDENGIVVINNNLETRQTQLVYEPVKAQLPEVVLSRTFKLTTENNSKVNLATEYIDSIEVLTGTQLLNRIGPSRGGGSNQVPLVEPEDINNLDAIQAGNQYLAIKSTFGTYKFIAISTIEGAMVETHDELQFATTGQPEQGANDYTSNDVKLYTYTASDYVRLYHQAPENNIGTDVHFKMPVTNSKKNVELVIAVIDGGEIADPQSEVVTPIDNQ